MACSHSTKAALSWWRLVVIIAAAVGLLPLILLNNTPMMQCTYMLIVMAIYWITEALPLAVTSLIPIVMVPLMGFMSSNAISMNYTKGTSMLFIGSLMVAVVVEKWQLHRRIALNMLKIFGVSPRFLMLGCMLPTWFLSMWISNTATAAMMTPIVKAVLESMEITSKRQEELQGIDNIAMEDISVENGKPVNGPSSVEGSTTSINTGISGVSKADLIEKEAKRKKYFVNLYKAMYTSIAYAANSGGIATITGTPPNLVLMNNLESEFRKGPLNETADLSFATWMGFATPISVVVLLVAWIWIQIFFLGFRETFGRCCPKKDASSRAASQVIADEIKKLGPMTFPELVVLLHFILMACLWLFRTSDFFHGWAYYLPNRQAKAETAAMFVAVLLFIFPSQLPCMGRSKKAKYEHQTSVESVNGEVKVKDRTGYYVPLIEWRTMVLNLPWGIILLIGGGFALADASKVSGLSVFVGKQLETIVRPFDSWVQVLLVAAIVAMATEITSNTAITSIVLPMLASTTIALQKHPYYLMFSATISASFAFMLPVATPPNAIVFASGHLKIRDMALCGLVMNIICIGVVTLAINTYGVAYFNLTQYPAWANSPVTQ